jgi:hypothetical protein
MKTFSRLGMRRRWASQRHQPREHQDSAEVLHEIDPSFFVSARIARATAHFGKNLADWALLLLMTARTQARPMRSARRRRDRLIVFRNRLAIQRPFGQNSMYLVSASGLA